MPQYVVLEDAYLSESGDGAGRVYKQGETISLPADYSVPAHLRALSAEVPLVRREQVPASLVTPDGRTVPVLTVPPDPTAPQTVDSSDLG